MHMGRTPPNRGYRPAERTLRLSSQPQARFVALLATGGQRIQTRRSHILRTDATGCAATVYAIRQNGRRWPKSLKIEGFARFATAGETL